MARRPNKAADETAAPDIDSMTDEELEAAMAAEEAGSEPEAEEQAEAEAEEQPPEQEAEASEESEEAGDDDKGADDKEEDFVPHGRFHQANERRKAAEERAERLERRMEALLASIGKGDKEAPQAQEERDDPPSLEEDPAGYIQWQSRQIAKLNDAIQQNQRVGEERSQTQTLLQQSNHDMQAYVTEHPEAQGAYAFLAERGKQMLAEQGIYDPAKQAAELDAWQVRIAQNAQQIGIRPAAMLMTLARENGWQPPAPKQAAPDPKKAAEDIDRKEATKAAARSMRDTGAAVDTGMPTAEQIDQMDDAEFKALLKKFGGDPDRLEAALTGFAPAG